MDDTAAPTQNPDAIIDMLPANMELYDKLTAVINEKCVPGNEVIGTLIRILAIAPAVMYGTDENAMEKRRQSNAFIINYLGAVMIEVDKVPPDLIQEFFGFNTSQIVKN